ncbi:MAG: sulfite exporter TauE/SafE family protein [Sphingomonadales bacterium]
MDFTLYWFMFPVSILVATTAMLSGIGGAALFTPIFLIIFPLLGPEYMLATPIAAIGVALLTEVFGFSSGFVGYYRKGLIDFGSAVPFIAVGVPVAIFGALMLQFMNANILKGAYGTLMLILAWVMIRHHEPVEHEIDVLTADSHNAREPRSITARDGTVYKYLKPRQGKGAIATGFGAFLTGLLSVGIGEVVMPQLAKRNRIPVPVAAATSVFTVIVVIASASFTQISALVAAGGVNAVPWNLVAYTVPAVIIGGQIGPRLQGKVSQYAMERGIGILFAVIGVAMYYVTYQGLLLH